MKKILVLVLMTSFASYSVSASDTSVDQNSKTNRLLPFYSIPSVKNRFEIKCRADADMALSAFWKKANSKFAMDFDIKIDSRGHETVKIYWNDDQVEENLKIKKDSLEKLLKQTLLSSLDFYLSQHRVKALSGSTQNESGWTSIYNSIKMDINSDMTTLKISKMNAVASLAKFDDYLFVVEKRESKGGVHLTTKADFEKLNDTYFPKFVSLKFDHSSIDMEIKLSVMDCELK